MTQKIPNTPGTLPIQQRNQLEAIKEAIEVGEGTRGDPLLKKLTLKDLLTLGMIQLRDGFSLSRLTGNNSVGAFNPTATGSAATVDLTPPPAPANLVVTGAVSVMLLTWDAPTHSNHAYAEVWRNSTDNLATAVLIGSSPWASYADAVDPGDTYYYWIRFVSTADVEGPYNDTVGTPGTTGQDPQALLDALQGAIDESELTAALTSRLDGIEGNAGAIAAEVTNRTNAIAKRYQLSATAPSNPDVGDYWIDTANDNRVKRWNGASWADVSDGRITALQTEVAGKASSSALSALDSRVTTAEGSITTHASDITQLQTDVAGKASASALSALDTRVTTAEGTITSHSSSITSLNTTVGNNSATIATQGTSINGLEAKYTVKIDVNGHVAGYGLASEANNGAVVSTMQFAVDKFFIVSPGASQLAFAVDGGKVVMDGASIKDLTVTSGKIASLAVDKLTAGTITAAVTMNALAFNGGSMNIGSGKFTVDSLGNVDARAITIRDGAGNVIMSSGAGMPYGNISGVPTSLSTINSTEGTKLSGIESGATVGADWDSNVSGQPADSIIYGGADDAYRWGFNPQFADWSGTRPDGWDEWVNSASIIKEASIVRTGKYAARWTGNGATNMGMTKTVAFTSPLLAGTQVVGSFDYYLASYVSGSSGLLVDLGYDATYQRTVVNISDFATGGWSTRVFTASVPAGKRITYVRIYMMGSWEALPGGHLNGSIIFDNLSLSAVQQGAFAQLDQINSGNVSTYIASAAIQQAQIGDAAIGSAQIGNAQVMTLNIGADQVTVSVFARTDAGASVGTNYSTFVSGVLNSEGQPVLIDFDCYASATEYLTNPGGESPNYGASIITARILRNGVAIYTRNLFSSGGAGSERASSSGSTGIRFRDDSPGAGNNTYQIQLSKNHPDASASCSYRNLLLMGVKR